MKEPQRPVELQQKTDTHVTAVLEEEEKEGGGEKVLKYNG